MTSKKRTHSEKRGYPRVSSRFFFEIKTPDHIVTAKTINISCSGVCCETDAHIPLMTSLNIVLAIPFGDNPEEVEYVECNGIVVRVEEVISDDMSSAYQIAIFFYEIEEYERVKIENYVESKRQIAGYGGGEIQ